MADSDQHGNTHRTVSESLDKTEEVLVYDTIKKSMADMVYSPIEHQSHLLEQEIDVMLQKVAEYIEIVELIRYDTKTSVNTALPRISEKALELQPVFERIDSLEILLTNIDEVLKKLEGQAQMAENHFSTITNLKKRIFGALANLGKRHTDTSPQYQHQQGSSQPGSSYVYEPVEIFKTSDYFLHSDTQDEESHGT